MVSSLVLQAPLTARVRGEMIFIESGQKREQSFIYFNGKVRREWGPERDELKTKMFFVTRRYGDMQCT
jgi:hypothetical protein